MGLLTMAADRMPQAAARVAKIAGDLLKTSSAPGLANTRVRLAARYRVRCPTLLSAGRYGAWPFPSWQGYVVANIFGEQGDSVVQHASCRVVSLGVPVNSSPAVLATASGQRIDEPASDPAAADDGIDPEVLEVTNHSIAEGMRVEHIVRKPDQQALTGRCSGYKSAHRMFRVHYAAPQFP